MKLRKLKGTPGNLLRMNFNRDKYFMRKVVRSCDRAFSKIERNYIYKIFNS